jgi:protein-S-isoprenylcysteine O-methyltransferase Ste14
MIHHILLILLWILFGVLHSVLAAGWWKQKMQAWLGTNYKYYPLAYSVFAAISMILILVFQFTMQSPLLFTMPLWAKVLAGAPVLAGLAIMLTICRKYFFYLSGISVFYKTQPAAVLQTNGLHRYMRHPLYAGTLLFIWSLFLLMPYLNHLLACIIITVYTLLGAQIEEKKLVEQFGEKYIEYKKRVPMIVPGFRRV